MEKILDLTMLSDIFPTGYHGAFTAGVTSGSTVYVAGGGPVGLAAAYSAQLLGAAVVFVGDLIPERLEQARFVRVRADRRLQGRPAGPDRADAGRPGGRRGRRRRRLRGARARLRRRSRGAGDGAQQHHDRHPCGRKARHPGAVCDGRSRRGDDAAKVGSLSIRIGLGWAKSQSFTTGQCPVMQLPPRPDADDPARQGAHREGRQRHRDLARRGAEGLRGLRQRGRQEVRPRIRTG